MDGNKYHLKLRGNHMRYADQVIGNGNHHTFAEGCFENGKKWRVEAHTSRFWLFVDNYEHSRQALGDEDYQGHRTSPHIFYRYANMLLDSYAEKYGTKVRLPEGRDREV